MAKNLITLKVPQDWMDRLPEVANVVWVTEGDCDLDIGPQCQYFTVEMLSQPKLVEAVVKRAKQVKKGKVK